MRDDTRTHYDILGLTRRAQPHEVQRAYDRLREQMRAEAAAPDPRRAVLLQTAFEVLSDPVRREAYDASLRERRRRVPRVPPLAALGIAVAVFAVAALAWRALLPRDAGPPPKSAQEIATAAAVAVGRLERFEISGRATAAGMAVAIEEGVMLAPCRDLSPGAQLVVRIGARAAPARVAAPAPGAEACRLTVHAGGSWPLATAPVPAPGGRIYAVRLDPAGEVRLAEGTVRGVAQGAVDVSVEGTPVAGEPLVDAWGRVVAMALATPGGPPRYRALPRP